ncbi:fungal transcriptional regulatory [Pyrenophora seminiperda CCB06]|uniref:Fungal transcriptional regulatory n=1 Tax=Pyrenophora seminiperda CCB06 TaxID=1302712 RepID=A0A3M7M317_9PLEO|nr:fungal transcriptional regulatory [Pyrenophora seminiperda CCB06]
MTQKRLLSKDVISQHIDAYFIHIYHIPGLNFFHRPSMLRDLHNDRLPPILSTAICATVSGYLDRSKVGKELSVQWAASVDSYISANLNDLTLLNLQIMILSLFQNFSYRQFGRAWLILGMAARLSLGIQLNKDIFPSPQNESIALQECKKRLAWSIFIADKLYSGGIDELVAMPKRWMYLTLPLNEDDFLHERHRHTGYLNNDIEALSCDSLGISAATVILMGLRHDILQ